MSDYPPGSIGYERRKAEAKMQESWRELMDALPRWVVFLIRAHLWWYRHIYCRVVPWRIRHRKELRKARRWLAESGPNP